MSDPSSQPTQPLTDEELAAIRALWGDILASNTEETSFGASMVSTDVHLFDLKFAKVLDELSRLRAENTALAAKLDVITAFVNEPTTPEREAGMGTARRLVNDLMGIKSEPNQWEQMTNSALGLDQDGEGQANA